MAKQSGLSVFADAFNGELHQCLSFTNVNTDKARADINYFIECIGTDELGNKLIQAQFHREMQEFINSNTRGVIELPREHGKTTQMILRIAWEIGRNKNSRHKIVSSADDIAVGRGKSLREVLELPVYQFIFPEVVRGRDWSDSKFTVKRDIITPESTVECFGVHARATGGRTDFLWLDDPDDEEVTVSKTKRDANVRRVLNVWMNLLAPSGKSFDLCTPWHKADTGSTLKGQHSWPSFRKVVNQNMTPLWPERWTIELLKRRLKDIGSRAFARAFWLQYLSDEDKVIMADWIKFYMPTDIPKLIALGVSADLAISEEAHANYTAIGLLGLGNDHRVYMLELNRGRYSFPKVLKEIEGMAEHGLRKYNMLPTIGIESVAYQKAVPQAFKNRREFKFPVREIKCSASKYLRVSQFGVYVENGKFVIPGEDSMPVKNVKALYDEMLEFPSGEYDDCVDMCAQGTELLIRLDKGPQPTVSRQVK